MKLCINDASHNDIYLKAQAPGSVQQQPGLQGLQLSSNSHNVVVKPILQLDI